MLKLLILAGLVAGGVAALRRIKRAEAPSGHVDLRDATSHPEGETSGGLNDILNRVKKRAEEAIQAAHQAQAEKEAELNRQFDEVRGKRN
jgi:hypothetical protein